MRPLVFIGMMGSGKTTIGKALAKELNLTWIDTDDYIEQQTKKSIPELFDSQGEAYFRQLETKALDSVILNYQCISTGGGIIITPKNRDLLKNKAFVIHLTADIQTLVSRLSHSNRPLLQNVSLDKRLKDLINARSTFYQECANLTIDTSNLSIENIVLTIKNELYSKDF